MELTGSEVKMRRERLRLTQAMLAQRLDVAVGTLSRWEGGVQPIRHPGMLDLALRALEAGQLRITSAIAPHDRP